MRRAASSNKLCDSFKCFPSLCNWDQFWCAIWWNLIGWSHVHIRTYVAIVAYWHSLSVEPPKWTLTRDKHLCPLFRGVLYREVCNWLEYSSVFCYILKEERFSYHSHRKFFFVTSKLLIVSWVQSSKNSVLKTLSIELKAGYNNLEADGHSLTSSYVLTYQAAEYRTSNTNEFWTTYVLSADERATIGA